ncbi:MAG: TIGR04083 family peptide-modifying radical SAM enzyme, partial [Terriglobales bacterium]
MIVPSLACPAACAYCFGPRMGGPPMRGETLEAVVQWQNALGDTDGLEITFHGGEPLVPGIQFYSMALPLLRLGLAPRRVRFAMQSNLWLLTDELCALFREYGVSLGTSLDGPEPINDAQRGKGYFQRTMANIERARKHGVDVGCICTFTARSAPHTQEIVDFFVREGLNFSVHASVPSTRHLDAEGWPISPEAHGQLLVDVLERYLANVDKIRISTLDAMCRSVSSKRGSICTFTDCLGGHLAVAPDGTIYPCQRFAGIHGYELGNVRDCAGRTPAASPVWTRFQVWQEHISNECRDCSHLDYCRGGCPYNALAANGGRFNGSGRDPHCPSYRRFFDHVVDRALAEVFSQENIEAVVDRPDPQAGMLRHGKLLALMREGPHPQETAQHARRL